MSASVVTVDAPTRAARRRHGLRLLLGAEPPTRPEESVSATPLLDLAVNPPDAVTVVTTLYKHVLRREPEAEGLSTWTTHLEQGLSIRTVAKTMTQTPEFARLPRHHRDAVLDQLASWDAAVWLAELGVQAQRRTYTEGSVSDEVFVRALFEVAYQKAPDANELRHELARLDSGVGRETMLRAFAAADSVEHRYLGPPSKEIRARLRRWRDKRSSLESFRQMVALAEHRQITALLDTVRSTHSARAGS